MRPVESAGVHHAVASLVLQRSELYAIFVASNDTLIPVGAGSGQLGVE